MCKKWRVREGRIGFESGQAWLPAHDAIAVPERNGYTIFAILRNRTVDSKGPPVFIKINNYLVNADRPPTVLSVSKLRPIGIDFGGTNWGRSASASSTKTPTDYVFHGADGAPRSDDHAPSVPNRLKSGL
ncbi:uncharacterized protein N7483_010112 [Penicillium malachiteum]|uniref:uncharacterized protein n=1 Tax=Penicillium malachiteum TaxID=1324776 RepID=UPI002549BA6F|nr:uncharacterized protein N7483_010112 [Penicillium malachiteum]KAJ5712931.1 hypothetical protein N7483_010112 [Penicillium malachiteum]